MNRYRKVEVAFWRDAKVRSLSAPPPNARDLFLYLLTCPETTTLPGVVVAGPSQLAEALRWDLEGLTRALDELECVGMIQTDREARVIYLPNAAKYNPPTSPNVIKSWVGHFAEVPECALRDCALRNLAKHVETLSPKFGEAFGEAFGEGSGKPSGKPLGKPSGKPSGKVRGSLRASFGESGSGSGSGSGSLSSPTTRAKGGGTGEKPPNTIRSNVSSSPAAPLVLQPSDPEDAPKPKPNRNAPTAEVVQVWELYLDLWRKHIGNGTPPTIGGSKAGKARRKTLEDAVKEHGAEKACSLVRGLWASEHHREKGFTDIHYAFRPSNEVRFLKEADRPSAELPEQSRARASLEHTRYMLPPRTP